jgi:hypothetical protein
MARDAVPPSLVMGWRPETPQRRAFQFDPFEIAVKRKIEVQSRLFAVRDDIQPGGELVVDRGYDRVLL